MLLRRKSSNASATRPPGRNWTVSFGNASKPIRRSPEKIERRATMFDDLSDLYQQVILDHCKHPRNFHEMTNPTCSAQGHNPLCGDQLKLFLAMEGDRVKD